MPFHSIGYSIASFGTIAAGLLYKARIGEPLTLKQVFVLVFALAIWGMVAYASLVFFFPSHPHDDFSLAFLAIPLGVGYSEIFAVVVLSLQIIFKHLPKEFERVFESKYGDKK